MAEVFYIEKTPVKTNHPGDFHQHLSKIETEIKAGNYLTDAINWFSERQIPLYGIQKNPTQHTWTTSPKAYGQIIIDDAALGCPLIHGIAERPYVDWQQVREQLQSMGVLKH